MSNSGESPGRGSLRTRPAFMCGEQGIGRREAHSASGALPGYSRARQLRRAVRALAAPLVFGACVYDGDERCSPGQVFMEPSLCVCPEGSVLTPQGCVACGENEVAGANGCSCAAGLSRPTPDAPCQAGPQGLGAECDVASAPCSDAVYDHCQVVSGTSGYCTTRWPAIKRSSCARTPWSGRGRSSLRCSTARGPSTHTPPGPGARPPQTS